MTTTNETTDSVRSEEVSRSSAGSTQAGSVLGTGDALLPGASRISSDGRYPFIYQGDGNLVVYGPDGSAQWASNTNGNQNRDSFLRVQDDGNVVIYRQGPPIWATNTAQ